MKYEAYLKNPTFYYIGVPIAAALWAVLAGAVSYPRAMQAWQDTRTEAVQAEKLIDQLVTLQPKRLAYKVDENAAGEAFDFSKTINEFAGVFGISPSAYNLTVRGETRKANRRAQSASMSIKTIDIETLAQFLSALLLRWPDMKCEVLSFEKIKNTKNDWTATLSLTYYY
jgi:hypothetical protein